MIKAYGNKYLSGEVFPFQRIQALFWPVLLEQFGITFAAILNGILISGSGGTAFEAVSLVDTINTFVMQMFIALATGATVVVARYKGRNEYQKLENTVVQAIVLTTAAAMGLALLMIAFRGPVVTLLYGKMTQELRNDILFYTVGSCIGFPLSGFFNAVLGVLRGSGNMKVSSGLLVAYSTCIVIFGVLFIRVFEWGLMGVILANLATRLVTAVLAVRVLGRTFPGLRRNFFEYAKINKDILRGIFFIGIPTAVEQLFFNGGKIITQAFVVSLGIQMISINAISGQIYNLTFMPTTALSICMVTIVGTCMGAKAKEEAAYFVKNFIRTTCIINIAIGIISIPLLGFMVSFYSKDPFVCDTVRNVLYISLVGNALFMGFAYVQPAALRAAGDVRFVTVVSLICMWVIRVYVGYVLAIQFNLAVYGLWLAIVLEWVVRGTVYTLRRRSGKWLEINFMK